jgi:predicted transcriptional regulator
MVKEKPFLQQTAEDIMSRDLVLVPQEMSLRGAARLLSRAHISGAPVVNAKGQCVGVFSTTDIAHWAEKNHHCVSDPCFSAWQMMDVENLPSDRVAEYMTRDPVMVEPGSLITKIARKMLDARIHRVIVVAHDQTPLGIVSTTDIVAAVACADNIPAHEFQSP